jgi:hypothetical protein
MTQLSRYVRCESFAWGRAFCVIFFLLSGCEASRTVDVGRGFDVSAERKTLARATLGNENTQKRALIVVYGSNSEIGALDDPDMQKIIRNFYVLKQVRISYPYDEESSLNYFTGMHYQSDVSFDYYLLHRAEPYSVQDVLMLRKLGVSHTPAYIIIDAQGSTLWASERRRALDGDVLLRFVSP